MSGRSQIQIYARRDGTLGWRLLGANNREIGRGVRAHRSEQLCRRELAALQRDGALLDGRLRPAAGNRWLWELHDGDAAIALAAHTFDRPIRCQQSLQLFRAELPGAEVGATLRAWAVPARRLPSIRAVPRVFGTPAVPGRS